jgi:hypothetical protein
MKTEDTHGSLTHRVEEHFFNAGCFEWPVQQLDHQQTQLCHFIDASSLLCGGCILLQVKRRKSAHDFTGRTCVERAKSNLSTSIVRARRALHAQGKGTALLTHMASVYGQSINQLTINNHPCSQIPTNTAHRNEEA